MEAVFYGMIGTCTARSQDSKPHVQTAECSVCLRCCRARGRLPGEAERAQPGEDSGPGSHNSYGVLLFFS